MEEDSRVELVQVLADYLAGLKGQNPQGKGPAQHKIYALLLC